MLAMRVLVGLSLLAAAASFALSPLTTRAKLDWGPEAKDLKGKVCIVTGATRGIGKGIALGLGERGATVYATGRTDKDLQLTAQEITAKGGRGVAVVVDHNDKIQIEKLFQQVERDEGKVNVLVNNCFSAVDGIFSGIEQKFWEKDLDWWDQVNSVGLRAHFIASQCAVPLMLNSASEADPGLIVIVSSWGGLMPIFDAAYGVGKSAKDRMAGDLAKDLEGKPINVVSLYPGAVSTEKIEAKIINNEEASAAAKSIFQDSETPLFQGRAVAGLARDPQGTKRFNGKIVISADLGDELGFTDSDGSQPLSYRSIKSLAKGSFLFPLIPRSIKVPKWILAIVGSRF